MAQDGLVAFMALHCEGAVAVSNIVDGTDTLEAGLTSLEAIQGFTTVLFNRILNVAFAVGNVGDIIGNHTGINTNNIQWNIVGPLPNFRTYPASHGDGLYGFGGGIIANNIVTNTGTGCLPIYVDNFTQGFSNTNYVYNNFVDNIHSEPAIEVDMENQTNGFIINDHTYIYNNTLSCGPNLAIYAGPGRPIFPQYVTITNNHFIGEASPPVSLSVSNVFAGNNLTNTIAVANAAGYTSANNYQPTSSSSPTVNTGVSLSSLFTLDLLGVTRPQNLIWDIGAYEFKLPAANIQTLTVGTTHLGG